MTDPLTQECEQGNRESCTKLIDKYWGSDAEGTTNVFKNTCRNKVQWACGFLMLNHPSRDLSIWNPDSLFKIPVDKRFGSIPPFVADFLKEHPGWTPDVKSPRPIELSTGFKADIRTALSTLPAKVKRLLQRKLLGVFAVTDLGSSGIAYNVFGDSKKAQAGFVMLDGAYLDRDINDWATTKEVDPFLFPGKWSIAVELASGTENNRQQTVQYLLLHELGHIASIDTSIMPEFNNLPEAGHEQDFKFIGLTWRATPLGYSSVFDSIFPQRDRLRFYGEVKGKLPNSLIPGVYSALAKTSFVSTYAATNPEDDFAESFANYVWVVLMKKRHAVHVIKDGKIEQTLSVDWNRPELQAKKKLIEQLLN